MCLSCSEAFNLDSDYVDLINKTIRLVETEEIDPSHFDEAINLIQKEHNLADKEIETILKDYLFDDDDLLDLIIW